VIVFVAVLKSTVLKHRVYSYQWFGVLLNMVAVAMSLSRASQVDCRGHPIY